SSVRTSVCTSDRSSNRNAVTMRTLLLVAAQGAGEPCPEADQSRAHQTAQPPTLHGTGQLRAVWPGLLGYHEEPDPRRQGSIVGVDLGVLPQEIVVIETRETALSVIGHPKPL